MHVLVCVFSNFYFFGRIGFVNRFSGDRHSRLRNTEQKTKRKWGKRMHHPSTLKGETAFRALKYTVYIFIRPSIRCHPLTTLTPFLLSPTWSISKRAHEAMWGNGRESSATRRTLWLWHTHLTIHTIQRRRRCCHCSWWCGNWTHFFPPFVQSKGISFVIVFIYGKQFPLSQYIPIIQFSSLPRVAAAN
jgi:hypothetical protein